MAPRRWLLASAESRWRPASIRHVDSAHPCIVDPEFYYGTDALYLKHKFLGGSDQSKDTLIDLSARCLKPNYCLKQQFGSGDFGN